MSILRAACVAQTGPFDRSAVVAAVFELADLGTLNMSYDALTGTVRFTQRSSPNFTLTPEQRHLRSALFKDRKEVVLNTRASYGSLTGISVDELYRYVARVVVNDSNNSVKRQITTPTALLVLGLTYSFMAAITLLFGLILGSAVGVLIGLVGAAICAIPTSYFYGNTTTHERSEMLVDRGDNMVSYVLLADGTSYRGAEVTLRNWIADARHPSWWSSTTEWGHASCDELMQVWQALMTAIA